MSRLLSHLLLLIYAGVYLHCQPLSMRTQGAEPGAGTRQEQPRAGLCKKKLQTVQADPQADHAPVVKAKLLPLDLALGNDFPTLYFGLLFPADEPTLNPVRGPNAGPEQSFANHPNKAPPVRFS
ncbi:hypothetical protein GCM10011375_38800 [Hymenobacter qilianensis]|uniref:Uncharacterized protein n=2 Tax=Hymenobacter qilianensis TaxID=1385715 RepID=A0ACB5PX29_9BACT|nr:hypothetical protein [Hymenobacter qilianensis]QNP54282.1 hypothetical protein H9L05_21685 [Hymenobacter qilianensis]GGF79995.1 hypothetical protein GCM10011375_38800 [Hymenobacter qilianensis]